MLRQSLKMCLWICFITGIGYPLLITLIAQLTMPFKANGSFIIFDKKIVGSRLIGQKFESEKYFWGRPSAVDYNPLHSGGSNLGPTSLELKKIVTERRERLLKTHENGTSQPVPADLLFASGSGLDPHITLKAANFQKDRVAKARNFDDSSMQALDQLIEQMTERKRIGIVEAPCLNVLELNLALDRLKIESKRSHDE